MLSVRFIVRALSHMPSTQPLTSAMINEGSQLCLQDQIPAKPLDTGPRQIFLIGCALYTLSHVGLHTSAFGREQ